ncbi:MAG: flagellar biosynthesis protein FlhB [Geobacteraceae bacterium GWB2_52_12]|nr:MAG: flagellar biosynthesis protein FlhB [Geobacteraceae bacterium GWB2_52_12]
MLTSSLTLLAGIVSLYVFGNFMMDGLKQSTTKILSTMGEFQLTESNLYVLVIELFGTVVLLLAPLILAIIATAVVSSLVQDNGKLEFRISRLKVDFAKLNPMSGFKKLFNKDAMVELLKSLLKLSVIAWIAYGVVRDEMQNITFLAEADIQDIFNFIGHIAFKIVTHTCGIMIVLGLIDMLYVKWRYTENLKMTKQEVKDERKSDEGDPAVKGKIKSMQFQMARRRMTKIIPLADVVITNPTHFAVALKYDRQKMIAPVVLAKGMDIMAEAIKKIAREHSVTLVENRFLARELYDQVKENEPIPEALYAAVAEVLAYVYKLKGKV